MDLNKQMKLDYHLLDISDTSQIELIVRWNNSKLVKHCVHRFQSSILAQQWISKNQILSSITHIAENYHCYIMFIDQNPVGEVSYVVNTQRSDQKTALVGIMIGEEGLLRKGIASKALLFLENLLREQAFHTLYADIFEFNHNAIKLFKKQGYKRFGVVPEFTHWQGRFWSKHCFLKSLD